MTWTTYSPGAGALVAGAVAPEAREVASGLGDLGGELGVDRALQ